MPLSCGRMTSKTYQKKTSTQKIALQFKYCAFTNGDKKKFIAYHPYAVPKPYVKFITLKIPAKELYGCGNDVVL